MCCAKQSNTCFKVVNLTMPCDQLWSIEHNSAPIYLHGYHFILDQMNSEFIMTYHQQEVCWSVSNREVKQRWLFDLDEVIIDGTRWQLKLMKQFQSTLPLYGLTDNRLSLTFLVSADEETTWLDAYFDGYHLILGARSHHYLRLNLARHRAKDAG